MKLIWTSSCATSRNRASRGFTLTELAIVIGVIAILLGGIWSLASQTWETARQEQLKDEIFTVVKNVRAYFGSQNGVGVASNGNFGFLTPMLIGENVIPGDMVRTGPPCTNPPGGPTFQCADNPWGAGLYGATGSFGVCAWVPTVITSCFPGMMPGSAPQYFAIELRGITQETCIKAILNNSGANAPPGLYDVFVNGFDMIAASGALPPKADVVRADCAAPTNIVEFVYRIVSPQS